MSPSRSTSSVARTAILPPNVCLAIETVDVADITVVPSGDQLNRRSPALVSRRPYARSLLSILYLPRRICWTPFQSSRVTSSLTSISPVISSEAVSGVLAKSVSVSAAFIPVSGFKALKDSPTIQEPAGTQLKVISWVAIPMASSHPWIRRSTALLGSHSGVLMIWIRSPSRRERIVS